MDGITVLSTEVVPAIADKNYWWTGIYVFIIIFLIIVFAAGKEGMSCIGASITGLITGAVLGGIIGVCLFFSPILGKSEYTKYEVTISNDVPLTEFNEKYEILEQRGEIYTIREKVLRGDIND